MLRCSVSEIRLVTWLFFLGVSVVPAEPVADAFTSRMRNATLTGTWVPLQRGGLGAEKPDAYHVVRATRSRAIDGKLSGGCRIRGGRSRFRFPVRSLSQGMLRF